MTTTISPKAYLTSTSSTVLASCITAVPGVQGYMPFDSKTCNSSHHFYSSFTGNLTFAIVFGLSATAHLIEVITFK
ncbi:hypothetical protein FOC4_g10002980 [Fusarium odoratissimum]|uniref:Uncharacterized protein n=2 Tax=Fusarium oxysporum species complex TaxID=171631 RepID=N1S516_FUSC4|nr:hypothetical protein FOC4_g10002980 [Fusarium odoratissimum]TXC06411.1 hypothetical protein FocTR4_00010909 [Fusarium oxysporum f. sp. cubense]